MEERLRSILGPDLGDTGAKVLVEHTSDTGYHVLIGTTKAGQWFATCNGQRPLVFPRAAAAAAWLWRNGQCDFGVVQALQKAGWLTVKEKGLASTSRQAKRSNCKKTPLLRRPPAKSAQTGIPGK